MRVGVTVLRGVAGFHLLNVLVAIYGLMLVVVLLAATLMNSCLIGLGALLMVIYIPFGLVSCLTEPLAHLKDTGNFLAGLLTFTLWCASFQNLYTLLGPWICLVVGGLEWFVFYISFRAVKTLVEADVRLVNFVSSTEPSFPQDLQPEKCASTIDINAARHQVAILLIDMPPRGWMAIFYFGVIKVFVGILRASTVFFSVLQPAIALCSGGSFPLLILWETYQENPVVYVGGIALLGMVGAAGLVFGAKISVQATALVFGNEDLVNEQGSNQDSIECITESESKMD